MDDRVVAGFDTAMIGIDGFKPADRGVASVFLSLIESN